MHYSGDRKKLEWQGKATLASGYMMLHVEDVTSGKLVPIMIALGKVVPENWLGKRVRITVEDLD